MNTTSIPKLTVKAGPTDEKNWPARLIEEYHALLALVTSLKSNQCDWFQIDSNDQGTKWTGTCWTFVDSKKYTFNVVVSLPAAYPIVPPDIAIPELDGKTVKMYRGGLICTTSHFAPLWTRNVPAFGIAHAFMFGLSTWLSVEVPSLIQSGLLS